MKSQSFEPLILAASIATTVLCLFVPLLLMATIAPGESLELEHSTEINVGIAVILRATARRLLRSGAKGVVRTTFGTFSRTVARTVTRRLVRFFMHSVAGMFSKRTFDAVTGSDTDEFQVSAGGSFISLTVGFFALIASFWGVLYVASAKLPSGIAPGEAMGVPTVCFLAAIPLVVYGVLNHWIARWQGASVRALTEIDGLLIQGYFTGAGSFLPMVTDFECQGTARQKAVVAGVSLASLYAIHLILFWLGGAYENPLLTFSSGMFLVYCFVYSFPMAPLQGHDIWARSKLLWLALFIPVLLSFLISFPNELAIII